MITKPRCGFLRDDDGDGAFAACTEPAICLAWARECGEWVPACADCALGRNTQTPHEPEGD